jgi:HK97 family phage major capsid protein
MASTSLGDWLPRHNTANGYVSKTPMAASAGDTGGYLVPPELSARILETVAEDAFFLRLATVQPMQSRELRMPYWDAVTAPAAGVSPFFGGAQLSWTAEGGAILETEPKLRMLELTAWTISGHVVASNQLIQDAGSVLENYLLNLFGRALAWHLQYAFLRGDGVGKPLGVLNAPAALTVTRAVANQFSLPDAAKMLGKLLPGSVRTAVWIMHPSVMTQLAQQSGWQPNQPYDAHGAPGVLAGLPVYISEALPKLGTKGDVILVDPRLYVIGRRAELDVAVSPEVYLTRLQTVYRITARMDGRPWLSGPVTLQDATSTASAYVVLE